MRNFNTTSYNEYIIQANKLLAGGDKNAEKYFADALRIVQEKKYAVIQAKCLEGIATVNVWNKEYTRAIALYNAALVRCKNVDKKKDLIKLIKTTEEQFLTELKGVRSTKPSSYEQDLANKDRLTKLRAWCKDEIDKLDKWWENQTKDISDNDLSSSSDLWNEKATRIKHMYEILNTKYRKIIEDLIEECEEVLGPPLCEYAVIALGSLARGEATPFSDFEWAILIEDEEGKVKQKYEGALNKIEKLSVEELRQYEMEIEAAKRKQEENKLYFKNLAYLLHIKVLNLGETILPSMAIPSLNDFESEDPTKNWFFDDITPRGLAFDAMMPGASKTPLERQHKSEENKEGTTNYFELIFTVNQFVDFLSDERFKSDRRLISSLREIKLIKGSQNAQNFVDNITALLLKRLQSIENESGKCIKHSYVDSLLAESLSLYKFKGGLRKDDARTLDIKKDLYRPLHLFIEHLSMVGDITDNNFWDIVDKLHSKKFEMTREGKEINSSIIESQQGANNLKIAFSSVMELRLRNHLAMNKQHDHVTLEINEVDDFWFRVGEHNFQGTQINKIYQTVFALEEVAKKFKQDGGLCTEDVFLDDLTLTKAKIFHLYLQYEKARKYYDLCLKNLETADVTNKERIKDGIYIKISEIEFYSGKPVMAIIALEMSFYLVNTNDRHSAMIKYRHLGRAHEALGQVNKANEYFQQARSLDTSLQGDQNEDVGSRINYSIMLRQQQKFDEAEAELNKCAEFLKRRSDSDLSEDHYSLYTNFGHLYSAKKDYQKANSYYIKCLNLSLKLYGSPHIKTAHCYENLGLSNCDIGNYEESKKCCEIAVNNFKSTLNNAEDNFVYVYNTLGLVFWRIGKIDLSIKYFESCVNILLRQVIRNNNLLTTAYANLGDVYLKHNEFSKAKESYMLCLDALKADYDHTEKRDDKLILKSKIFAKNRDFAVKIINANFAEHIGPFYDNCCMLYTELDGIHPAYGRALGQEAEKIKDLANASIRQKWKSWRERVSQKYENTHNLNKANVR